MSNFAIGKIMYRIFYRQSKFTFNVMKVKAIKITGLTLAVAAVAMSTSCSSGDQQGQQQAPPAEIETLVVNPSTSELTSSYPTIIKGKTDIEIRPQVTGFITKVHVDEGDHVTKGQVLFTIDQVQYQAAVAQAEASVKVAQTAVSTAQLTADNKRHLYEKNIISQYEYQVVENQLAQAKSQLAQANAALVNAKKNLAYTTVTAPCSGVVGSIPNREGSLASPSSAQALTTVSDNSQVYAYFSLNEKDILSLTENGTIKLETAIKSMPSVKLQLADGTMYPFEGKVATVSGVIDNTTGAASVRALFDNPSGMLRSGSTGSVVFPHVTDGVILVPQKATYELQDRKYVYVVGDSSKVHSVAITVDPINDGFTYVVTSGLNAGDQVVVEGVGTQVKDGVVITPKKSDKTAYEIGGGAISQSK
jgi:membrane fusion protein (multidrug efflux system)